MGIHIFSEQLCPTVKVVAIGPRYRASQIDEAFPKGKAKPKQAAPTTMDIGSSVSLAPEYLLIADAAASYLAQANQKLWSGEWDTILTFGKKQVYPSQSQADMSLASRIAHHLVKEGVPADLLYPLTEAVFDRSALARRDKWQSRVDYKLNTVSRACASATANFNTPSGGAVSATAPTPHVDWSLHGDVRNARFFADKWHGLLAYV